MHKNHCQYSVHFHTSSQGHMATIAFTAHNIVQPHGTHAANRPKWAQVVQKVLASLEEWSPVSKPLDKFTSSTSLDCLHYDWRHVHQFPGRLLVFYRIHKVQNLHKRTTIEKIDRYISSSNVWTLIIWTPNLAYDQEITCYKVKWPQSLEIEPRTPVLCH